MARNKHSAAASLRSDRNTASAKRDEEFLADRRRREAANLKRTLELRAQRLAHAALNPPAPKLKPRRKAVRAASA
jgi:hypothetical protein